ncbi:chemotaxis protein CheA [Melioribacteraceae bacterium 4301-Me]|uniref:chemotaxis protein CheA n=1 Tax=Pyranulibacter aquaticus TaxID=3163344 RepID=UPI003595A5BC
MKATNELAVFNDASMKEIVESFIVETKEIIENLDLDLVELENNPNDSELLNKVFRAFHTIKGTSGFLGLEKLPLLTHKCEDILNKLRKGEEVLTSEMMDGLLSAFDKIKLLLNSIETNKNENVNIQKSLKELDNILNGKSKSTKDKKGKNSNPKSLQAKSKKTDEIINLKEEKFVENNDYDEEKDIPDETNNDSAAELNSSKTNVNSKKEDTSIRVEVERLDQLLNIVSELVLGRNRLAQITGQFATEFEGTDIARDLSETTKHIDLMTNELQLVVMKTRMIKIGKIFNRFPRLVRDLSKEMNKNIKLEIKGEETELDKTLIEEIYDPLVHLVRNSVDHGIEQAEERKRIGKDPTGKIVLSAHQEGNDIIISIEDDGRGIDPELIKQKAISKNLISEAKAKELSVQDIYNLIFLPGFSTAEQVTNVSGRGVGMDVVRTNVQKLRGIINIESVVGEGTKIIIRLPLTLAIITGMIVRIDTEYYVIPLSTVIEVIREHSENIYSVNGNEVVKVRDVVLPLVDLTHLLNKTNGKKQSSVWQYIVVCGIAEKRFGIKVDELMGQKEVVIKSLGSYLGNVKGIAGSTIMGDGRVVMILDIGELINMKQENE